MNTPAIKAAMRLRYCAPEWALLYEVGNATGATQRRWADAVAMNLYPSRGLTLHGFEFKVSRSDWSRELKNPDKSVPVQQYCDHWWIVAPAGIVKIEELPPTWGLLELHNGKLRQAVNAPKLDAVPMTRGFMAAMLRRASGADEAEVKGLVELAVNAERETIQKRIDNQVKRMTERSAEAIETLNEIEHASGMKINRWVNNQELCAAIRLVVESGVMASYGSITGLANKAQDIADRCRKALDQYQPHITAASIPMPKEVVDADATDL